MDEETVLLSPMLIGSPELENSNSEGIVWTSTVTVAVASHGSRVAVRDRVGEAIQAARAEVRRVG